MRAAIRAAGGASAAGVGNPAPAAAEALGASTLSSAGFRVGDRDTLRGRGVDLPAEVARVVAYGPGRSRRADQCHRLISNVIV